MGLPWRSEMRGTRLCGPNVDRSAEVERTEGDCKVGRTDHTKEQGAGLENCLQQDLRGLGYSAATRVSSPDAAISRRSHSGAMSKPLGQVGAPNSRKTRAK